MKQQKMLWLLVGLPGSGKSYYARRLSSMNGGVIVSRDEIRFSLLNKKDSYFSKEKEVFRKYCGEIQKLLLNPEAPNDIYADATHLDEKSRLKLIKKLKKCDYKLGAIFFNTPLEVCLERNDKRTGREKVPRETILKMNQVLSPPFLDTTLVYKRIIEVGG